MADGRFAAIDLLAATPTILFTGAVGKTTCCTIGMTNRDSGATPKVRLGMMNHAVIGSVVDEDWYLVYGTDLNHGFPIRETGVVVAAGHSVVVYSDTANVSVGAHGFEETA